MTLHMEKKIDFDPDEIPQSLKELSRWAPWKLEWNAKRGKFDKIPHNPKYPDRRLSTAKTDKWVGFDEAQKAMVKANLDGLGLVLTNYYDVIGIDLDGCFDQGVLKPWAKKIMQSVASYTEISPSGNGLRILCRSSIPGDWTNHDVGIEVYGGWEARFLTVTGSIWPGSEEDLVEVDPAILEAIAEEHGAIRRKADVISMMVPDILEDVAVPENLNASAKAFLADGTYDDDRSASLQWVGVSLLSSGLTEQEAFSLLANNEHAMDVALSHRRYDHDRALTYLWTHHIQKAKGKAHAVTPISEFEDISTPEDSAVRRLASMEPMEYERHRKAEAEALGVRASVLDKAVKKVRQRGLPTAKGLPKFKRNDEGHIIANVDNTFMALQCFPFSGMRIAYDRFRDEVMFSRTEGDNWESFKDEHYVELRIRMDQSGFERTTKDMTRDTVHAIAKKNEFDSAITWLTNIVPEWDGVERVRHFNRDYLGCEADDWSEAVSLYMWSAMAGRVLEPGCKADMVPVWISPEGRMKSTMVSSLSPDPEFFSEMSFHEKEVDLSRKMRGCLIAELAELAGLSRKEVEPVKSWITRRFEDWTPKFQEYNSGFKRRLVFVGTTNEERFLIGETGHRRFLPLYVSQGQPDALIRDRDQLWAEARELFREKGVIWQAAEKLGKSRHAEHMVEEPWAVDIRQWLDTPDAFSEGNERPADREFICVHDVLEKALRLDKGRKTRFDEIRVGKAMKQLGYQRQRRMVNGVRQYVYCPICPIADLLDFS